MTSITIFKPCECDDDMTEDGHGKGCTNSPTWMRNRIAELEGQQSKVIAGRYPTLQDENDALRRELVEERYQRKQLSLEVEQLRLFPSHQATNAMWLRALGADRTDFATGLTEKDIQQAVNRLVLVSPRERATKEALEQYLMAGHKEARREAAAVAKEALAAYPKGKS